jgi:hypothetical protein
VAGLALLTPIFVAGLNNAQAPAEQSIAALVIDAPLPVTTKLTLAEELSKQVEAQDGRVPDLTPAFRAVPIAPADAAHAATLHTALNHQLERAASRAFRDAFLVAGLLALLAIVPALMLRDPERSEPRTPDDRSARAVA